MVQLVHDLSDGSLLRITYGAWYTPEEIALNGVGIEPDILVEVSEDVPSDADPWLQAERKSILTRITLVHGEATWPKILRVKEEKSRRLTGKPGTSTFSRNHSRLDWSWLARKSNRFVPGGSTCATVMWLSLMASCGS